jgi:uncharacterized protein
MYSPQETLQQSLDSFMYRVNAWMATGLAITGLTGYALFQSESFFSMLMYSRFLFLGLLIAQVALVIFFSTRIFHMSFAAAIATFIAYSILSGITLSFIFAVYEMGSIALVFGITMALFSLMAMYGYTTKTDLTSMGSFLLMALLGLIIAGVVNLFLRSSAFNFVISAVGVLVFVGLTAYDVQKIKQIGQGLIYQGQNAQKAALLGALILYLDFVNLFLNLLSLFGKRRR